MTAHYDIEQGTEEWHRMRWGKIGGTLAKGLFIKSDTLMLDVLSEISEEFQLDVDGYTSPEMQRGNELEPIAREQLSKYIGVNLLNPGWLSCDEIPLLGISPDGLTLDETIGAEIKCPQAKKHTSTVLADEIPNDNINQCVHYFTVNPKLEKLYFCSFRPESKRPLFVKMITRSSLVNLGTKARPVIKSVQAWTELAKINAIELQKQINLNLEKLCTI